MGGYINDEDIARMPSLGPRRTESSSETEDGDVYTFMPEPERVVDHGVSQTEIDEAERVRERRGYIGYVFHRQGGQKKPERYDLIRLLGRGAFGRAYTATQGGRDRTEKFVIKEISARPLGASGSSSTPEGGFDTSYVERELRMSKLIEERLGKNFCQTRAICADRRFFTPNRRYGYIVFPFYNAHSLNEYLGMIMYPRMRAFLRQKSRMGFGALTLLAIIDAIAAGDRRGTFVEGQIDDARAELRAIQTKLLGLAVQILSTLALLHSKKIFHRDYKPDNMLIGSNTTTQAIELRVIDFGLACAVPLPQSAIGAAPDTDLQFRERYEPFVACPDAYITTPQYRDPVAWYMPAPKTDAERERQSEKYDTYAVAKTLLRLFSPDSYNSAGVTLKFPVMKETEFMPPRFYQLLVEMTGENGYEPANVRLQTLTDTERARRLASYSRRPTTRDALRELLNIVKRWETTDRY